MNDEVRGSQVRERALFFLNQQIHNSPHFDPTYPSGQEFGMPELSMQGVLYLDPAQPLAGTWVDTLVAPGHWVYSSSSSPRITISNSVPWDSPTRSTPVQQIEELRQVITAQLSYGTPATGAQLDELLGLPPRGQSVLTPRVQFTDAERTVEGTKRRLREEVRKLHSKHR